MRKPKKFYLVDVVVHDMPIVVHGFWEQKLPLSWADGMVGVIPVFTNKRKAQRYARRNGAGVTIAAVPEKG